MTDTEELIVAAMRAQADRRPDGAAVRAALTDTRPRKGVNRTFLIVGAAALVAAVAIAITVVAHDSTGDGGTPAAAQPAHLQVTPPAAPVTEMDVAPQYLPPRLVERERISTSESFTRTWLDGEVDADGTPVAVTGLSVAVGPGHLPAGGKPLTINGKPAKELTGDQATRVVWEQSPGKLVTVTAFLGLDEQQAGIAERVAKSVHPADPVRFEPQVRFGSLPAGWTSTEAKIFGASNSSPKTFVSAKTTYQGHEFVLTFGQLSRAPGKVSLVVAARDGYEVSFPMGTATGHLPGWPDFSGVLGAIQVDQHADVSWIGTR